MADARQLSHHLDDATRSQSAKSTHRAGSPPFGLYCLIALAAGVAIGVILIDFVTRPAADPTRVMPTHAASALPR